MDSNGGLFVHHFISDWIISSTIWLIAMKLCAAIHNPQGIHYINSGDPLTSSSSISSMFSPRWFPDNDDYWLGDHLTLDCKDIYFLFRVDCKKLWWPLYFSASVTIRLKNSMLAHASSLLVKTHTTQLQCYAKFWETCVVCYFPSLSSHISCHLSTIAIITPTPNFRNG